MKKFILFGFILLVLSLFNIKAQNCYQNYAMSFNSSPSELTTSNGLYGLYWQPINTTNPNSYNYLGACNEGQTNINFSTTNAPTVVNLPNPVNLFVEYQVGTNSVVSAAFPFDTNSYLLPPPPLILFPPTFLHIHGTH